MLLFLVHKRAIQTVQGIANTYKLSIQTEEDLRERLLSTEPVSNFNDAMQNVERLEFCIRRRRIEYCSTKARCNMYTKYIKNMKVRIL